jgi:serine protease AprX
MRGKMRIAGAAAVAVAAGMMLAGPTSGAAEPPPGARGPAEVDAPGVGKGDVDDDRIADDLAAALDDAEPGDRVGVIVQGTTPAKARGAAPSFALKTRYHIIPAFAGSLVAGQVRALARIPGVTRVELDGITRALDASGDLDYGVTAARESGAAGDGALDGDGVGICMIDTGIDPDHEQLAGRVVGWKDWVNGRTTPYDDHGHGTHVSSIAAGSGAGTHPEYGGVATAASLVGAKVLSSAGSGADSDVVSAIEWCAGRSDVDVLSMSLGSGPSDGSDAGSQAADAAVAQGKVVVAAAGNSGDGPGTISSPGVATDVITVGAASDPSSLAGSSDTDTGLYLAGFSSRGPTSNPDAALKPDVVAPGMSVVAAKAGTTSGYVAYSGTSMATPFVAGTVALARDAAPAATPAQIKSALQASAHDAGAAGPDNEWGHGLVDARAFVAALGATSAGAAPWPAHQLVDGSVGAGQTTDTTFDVATAGQPLGVTLQTVNGSASCLLPVGNDCWWGYEWAPDIDAYLVDPSGSVVAMSRCMLEASNGNCAAPGRFETLGIASAAAGTWTLRVESFTGAGDYRADIFGAVGGGEPPPPTPPDPTPPSAPTGLSAVAASTTSVELTWNDTAGDETGFAVERCTGPGCTDYSTVAPTLPADAEAWTDSTVVADTTYRYRVWAFNDAGSSGHAGPVSATTPADPTPTAQAPSAPAGLTATDVSPTRVVLEWADTSDTEDGFRVFRCDGKRCTNFTMVGALGANTSTWSDTNVTRQENYSYYVAAFNGAGSSPSDIISVRTPRR